MEKGRLSIVLICKPPPCLLGATLSTITAPTRRRGPGSRLVTSFEYNLRHNPSTNFIAHNNLVSAEPWSMPMGDDVKAPSPMASS
jgi:hypothetical protein